MVCDAAMDGLGGGVEGKSFRGRKTTVISTHAGSSADKRCLCSWYKQRTNRRMRLKNFTFSE